MSTAPVQTPKPAAAAARKSENSSAAQKLAAQKTAVQNTAAQKKMLHEQGQKELQHIKETYSRKKENEIKNGEAAVNHIKKKYSQEEVRRREALEKARLAHEAESQALYKAQQSQLIEQKTKYQELLRAQNEYFKQESQDMIQKQSLKREQQKQLGLQQLSQDVEQLKRLRQQKWGEFEKQFQTQDQLAKDALKAQSERLKSVLQNNEAHVLQKINDYAQKSADPFYQLKDFESQLEEQENFYILRTKIPEHEKKNVDVIVKKDRVIVSAQREFNEKVSEPGKQRSTNSYQSFREVLPLRAPALTKAIDKEYTDGILTVKIPKLFFGDKS